MWYSQDMSCAWVIRQRWGPCAKGPISLKTFAHNYNSMKYSSTCGSIICHQVATKFCTCLDNTVVVSYEKLCTDHCVRIGMNLNCDWKNVSKMGLGKNMELKASQYHWIGIYYATMNFLQNTHNWHLIIFPQMYLFSSQFSFSSTLIVVRLRATSCYVDMCFNDNQLYSPRVAHNPVILPCGVIFW